MSYRQSYTKLKNNFHPAGTLRGKSQRDAFPKEHFPKGVLRTCRQKIGTQSYGWFQKLSMFVIPIPRRRRLVPIQRIPSERNALGIGRRVPKASSLCQKSFFFGRRNLQVAFPIQFRNLKIAVTDQSRVQNLPFRKVLI